MKTSGKLLGMAVALAVVVALVLATSCGKQPPRRGAARGGCRRRPTQVTSAALATYVAPGDLDEYYLFYSGGSRRPGVCRRHAIHAAHRHHPGVHALSRALATVLMTRARRCCRRYTVGRLASSGLLRDRWRVRRPLAVHQRQRQWPHRAHRSAGFQDQTDPQGGEHLGQSRQLFRIAQHRVRDHGDPNVGADSRSAPTPTSTEYARNTKESLRASRSIPRMAR